MKTRIAFYLCILVAVVITSSCNNTAKKSDKTIENLKAAIIGETTASAKYDSFAAKSKRRGF